MTRFARAKGSKSSNEKKPEEATTWAEMKNAMLSKKSSLPEENPSGSNAPKEELKIDVAKQTEWASLGDDLSNSTSLLKQNLGKKNVDPDCISNSCTSSHKFKKKKEKSAQNVKDKISVEGEKLKFNRKNNEKKHLVSSKIDSEKNNSKVKVKNTKRRCVEMEGDSDVMLSAKKKKLMKTKKVGSVAEEKKMQRVKNTERECNNFNKMKKEIKTNYFKKEVKKSFISNGTNRKPFDGNSNKQSKLKKKKDKNFKEGNSGVEELIINGEKIPIVKFQGFYVTLEDAERLKKLRSEMIKEGIPKSKLEAAIKLERRRAEKALSRLKKSVCFHCRGHGHLLSNCPKLTENENTSTGICYKCGSTEHSASECKVIKGSSYQFAECFICKEQGHIARQCPDNPRGLYPQGGGCRECGDVTHLRKDCPKVISQKAEEVVTVGLRSERDLECLDEEIANREKKNVKNKVKKSSTVKF